MNIAVTAASGQLGSASIRALRSDGGHTVVGLARSPGKAAHPGIEVRQGDYDRPDQLTASLRGIDAVLLVSGMAEPSLRIQQHRNVIEAAREAGVRKIVYTSIQGPETSTAFSPVVESNRQTEADVRESGLEWVIGRNGIYVEPDVEYMDTYVKAGRVANCAGDALCGYTTRPELGFANAKMLSEEKHAGETYNLHGEPLTQADLTAHLNAAFGTDLVYEEMSVEAYRADRVAELGDFLGGIIAGIYAGIRRGAMDNPSHYVEAAGREHQSWDEYFAGLRPS